MCVVMPFVEKIMIKSRAFLSRKYVWDSIFLSMLNVIVVFMKQPLATKIIITVFDYIQNVLRLKTADNGRKTMHDFVSIFTTTAQL